MDVSGPSIALRAVTFSRGTRRVLGDCTFVLPEGGRIGLMGPNGAGKTTLLHLVVGLCHPESGDVEVFGETRRTEADFAAVRHAVGLLFQDSDDQLFCPTVYEDIAFGPQNLGLPRAEVDRRVRAALQRLHLEGYDDRVTHRLSYGEKRLVALATLLAMEPRVLLLDEPTNGLDSRHEARLIEVLNALPQDLLIVSHNRPFLEAVGARIAILDNGQVEDEPPLA